MSLPFTNDTSAVEKKLAQRSLKADKARNRLLVLTIMLAAGLIMAVLLTGYGTQRAARESATGLYQAHISRLDDEAVRMIKADSRVLAGFSAIMGYLDYGDYKVMVRSMDEHLLRLAKYPAFIGRLPEAIDEVALTQAFMEREGISAHPGDTLLLDLTGEEAPYTLCGILPVTDANYAIYVSPDFVQRYAAAPELIAYISVKGTDGLPEESIKAHILKLADEWGLAARDVDFAGYYFSLIRQRSGEYLAVMALIIGIVILACALVIYSLFFVSIIRKANEYGRLRTIGATCRQIRRIVMGEGRRLLAAGIPPGLIAGAIVGYGLTPKGWSLAAALCIGALTAAIMILCVLLSVWQPARLAAAVTPIEAIRLGPVNAAGWAKSSKRLKRPLSTGRLALINFTRSRQKTVLTIFSLGVCGILLMSSAAYYRSIDPLSMARESFPYGRVRIELGDFGPQGHTSRDFLALQQDNPLTPELRQQIEALDGVRSVRVYSGSVLDLTTPTGITEPLLVDAYPGERQALLDEYLIAGTADEQTLCQNNGVIIKQMEGWQALLGWEAALGDTVTLSGADGGSWAVTVMGIVAEDLPYGGYELMYMPEQAFSVLKQLDEPTYQLLIDTQEDQEEQVRQAIKQLLPAHTRVYVTTLSDWAAMYQVLLAKYRTPVYLFVLFVGVFGAINLLNTLLTNVLARRQELGVFQAVGMSSRQLAKMLWIEGLLYILGAFVLTVALGTLSGLALCRVLGAMSVFGEVSYHFPLIEMAAFFGAMLIIQTVFSRMIIKQLASRSLAEQTRELT